jgi:hypothetical protein
VNDKFRNKPCPCGKKDLQGKPLKYKKCCGKPGIKRDSDLDKIINVDKTNIEILLKNLLKEPHDHQKT